MCVSNNQLNLTNTKQTSQSVIYSWFIRNIFAALADDSTQLNFRGLFDRSEFIVFKKLFITVPWSNYSIRIKVLIRAKISSELFWLLSYTGSKVCLNQRYMEGNVAVFVNRLGARSSLPKTMLYCYYILNQRSLVYVAEWNKSEVI